MRAARLPSFMLDVGQWATPTPVEATNSKSSSVSSMQWAATTSGPRPIRRWSQAAGVSPPDSSATRSTSPRVSARWVWMPTPSWSARSRMAV